MSLTLGKPQLILAPVPTTNRHHARSPSRASPTRPRITDDLLSDLSPATTLAAFTSTSPSSGKLRASIEAASTTEREFGIRAVTAANKIKEWVNELTDWPWPESNSAGFEAPIAKRRKLSIGNDGKASSQNSTSQNSTQNGSGAHNTHYELQPENDTQDWLYCGSLYAQDVERYSIRIDEILDDMEDLDVGGIKSHILDLHIPGRSRPSSSASTSTAPSFSSYTKMDDFTAVITAIVLQALPYLARLQNLMDVWGIRLVVLRQIKPLFDALKDAEAAIRSGWQVLMTKPNRSKGNDEYLTRDAFNTMQNILQNKVLHVGQKLDRMLDSLEGRQDTLPDAWLDRMESLEQRYADWVALANRRVLEGELTESNRFGNDTTNHHSPKSEAPPLASTNNEKLDSSPTATLNDAVTESQLQDIDIDLESSTEIPILANITSLLPGRRLSPISPFDGGKEIPEEKVLVAASEPITPQTPSFDIINSFRSEADRSEIESIFPSTPPSSKSSPAAKLSPIHSILDHEKHQIEPGHSDNIPEISDLGYEPNEAELETPVIKQSKIDNEQSSTETEEFSHTKVFETKAEQSEQSEADQSRVTTPKDSDGQLGIIALAESTNAWPSTSRKSLDRDEIDTRKSFHQYSEITSSPPSLHSVLSTGSNYEPVESSLTAGERSSSQFTRRVLSTIQSSSDLFDLESVKTPTKNALHEKSNTTNLFQSKEDGQTTSTPNNSFVAQGLDDESDSEKEIKENLATSEILTPDPKGRPVLSFDEASPEGALPPLPAMLRSKKSLHLLDSPDFSSHFRTPETPLEPPVLPNVDVLETPALFSPIKGPTDQLQQQINEILQSLPIRLTSESEKNSFPDLNIPKKRGVKKTVSTSSLRLPSRSPTPTPSFSLTPAYGKNSPRPRHQNANPEIKLYHLSRSNGGAPIKLFVRLVGENGERVMVRVGGGWADLGEYLREYAIHHSRRNAPEDKIHIHDSSSRIVSTSSISSARNGRSSPISRSASSMDSRPATSMGNSRTPTYSDRPVSRSGSSLAMHKTRNSRKSISGEDSRYRTPSTPMPTINRTHRGSSVSHQETPPSATSTVSRSSSRLSHNGEESFLGLSGPRSKHIELSEENEKWVESMTEKVKQASAEKEKKEKHQAILGDMGKVGSTKRLFRKS